MTFVREKDKFSSKKAIMHHCKEGGWEGLKGKVDVTTAIKVYEIWCSNENEKNACINRKNGSK